MTELEALLRAHAGRYSKMEPADAVKLLYQNEFGGGHLIRDAEGCLAYLRAEYDAVSHDPDAPLLENLGGGLVRLMLPALDAEEYPLEQVARDFIRSAQVHRGRMEAFLAKLRVLEAAAEAGVFAFSPEALAAYLSAYRARGCPPVSHSDAYRRAYHPAYRVMVRALLPEKYR